MAKKTDENREGVVIFGDEVFLDHFLKAKGELRHG